MVSLNSADYGDIVVRFPKPVRGYWNGGEKTGDTFTAMLVGEGGCDANPKAEASIKWSSWGLNSWSWRPVASTPARTAAAFIRVLRSRFPVGTVLVYVKPGDDAETVLASLGVTL